MNPEVSSNDRLVDRLGRNATLGAIGDSVQPILRDWLDGSGGVKTPLKDILHGTWLGHSLHPAITDIPVGAFSVTAIADLLTLAGADASAAADFALGVGLIGSLGAIVTGFAEWSDTKGEPKNIGMARSSRSPTARSSRALQRHLRPDSTSVLPPEKSSCALSLSA